MSDILKGSVVVAGLGPGDDALVTPVVVEAITQATDVVGYIPYVERIKPRIGLTLHATDNRVELERAEHALKMASQGKRVLVVSSGDPGVFAMASAIFEAYENNFKIYHDIDIRILPGITAMLAAAASIGAPLGHDFCAINLSDNLKPWELIEKRLRLAGQAGFSMAFYNPRSASRPNKFERVLEILCEECGEDTLIAFARNVSRPNERVMIMPLKDATSDMADMRTVVIVGNADTRQIGKYIYAPRQVL